MALSPSKFYLPLLHNHNTTRIHRHVAKFVVTIREGKCIWLDDLHVHALRTGMVVSRNLASMAVSAEKGKLNSEVSVDVRQPTAV